MRKLTIALAGTLILVEAPAMAEGDQVLQGPIPSWVKPSDLLATPENPEGVLFIRRQDTIVHLDGQGQSYYQGQRIRILHPQALELGNISIVWNPAVGKPVVHSLKIHRDGEQIDVLRTSTFEILRREDQLETAMLDGVLTATLRVPDLRVGDELEFEFTAPSHDPTMLSMSYGLLLLAQSPPGGRVRLGLSWTDGERPRTRIAPDLADKAIVEGNAIDIRIDNPSIITPPKGAPPRYSWLRIVEYTDFDRWEAVSRRFATLFNSASRLEKESPLRKEAASIAANHNGDLARAQAALRLVQQQVRYIYVGLNGGNLTPVSADETWSRRYGDCKGKTAVLLALLAEMEIDAAAVLVNNSGGDDGLDQRLPSPGMFDHVLVRAIIDGKQYWLDGTLPEVIEADTTPFLPYRWVLPVSVGGNSLEKLPQMPFALPQEMGLNEIDARAGFEQPARIVHTSVKRGIDGLSEYMQFSTLTAQQLEIAFRNALSGGSQWDEIESVSYSYDRGTKASILTIAGHGPVDWDDDGDGAFSLSLPGGGFNPPDRRQRAGNQDQAAPFYNAPSFSCYATTVRLPEGTDIKHWGFNSTFDTMLFGRLYYRMMERRDDGTIRMVRGARVEESEIGADRTRRDNERLADFDNSMANIEYDPVRIMTPWGNLAKVPATYEVDWTSTAAPCLPNDVLE